MQTVSLEPLFEAVKEPYSYPMNFDPYDEQFLSLKELRDRFNFKVRSDVIVNIEESDIKIIADPVHVVAPGSYPSGMSPFGYLFGQTDRKELSTTGDQQLSHLGKYTGLNQLILDDTKVMG